MFGCDCAKDCAKRCLRWLQQCSRKKINLWPAVLTVFDSSRVVSEIVRPWTGAAAIPGTEKRRESGEDKRDS